MCVCVCVCVCMCVWCVCMCVYVCVCVCGVYIYIYIYITSYTEDLDKQLIDWKTSLKTEEFPAFHLTVHKITTYPTGEVSFMFF